MWRTGIDKDGEEYDSIQLNSLSEVTEFYYQLLKKEMESSAAETKRKNSFDGSLQEEAANHLTEFAEKNQITSFSQALAELLTLLEWHNENKTPVMQESAIYNALLRVEKAANNTSTWELCGQDCDGPLISVSTYEMNMLEQTVSMYLLDVLTKDRTQILFFPLTEVFQSDILLKWRQNLTKILKDLKSHVDAAAEVVSIESSLFKETSCCYFDCLSRVLDEKLHPVCLQVMKWMDVYQEYHRTFHVNLRDSCALSHALYLQVKNLVNDLRLKKKLPQSWKLEDYNSMFVKFFMNLLQVVKSECHSRIKRAVEAEMKDSVHTEEKILSSSVIVLNCFCTVIDEWKHMEIEDEDLQVAFLIKIADIVCDGAKIYAEVLDERLTKESQINVKSEVYKKACILANSVEHVRAYLEDLSHQMQWKESLHRLNEESPDSSISDQVLRILNLLHQSMDSHLKSIAAKCLNIAACNVQSLCEKPLSVWIQATNLQQGYDRFLCHFNEYMETSHEALKEVLFPRFLSLLWCSILMYIQKEFQEGQPPDYAITLKENIQNLMDYLLHIKMECMESSKPILRQIMSVMDLNSKSTVDLQLDYYSQIAESLVSPVEYLGHIAFQAGYKQTTEDTVDLYINVQKGQRLPARTFEMSELYVRLTLCPSSLFPNQVPLKSTSVTEDLDSPLFNQFFQFLNRNEMLNNQPPLTLEVFPVKGSVVQVLVVNQDKSLFSEECVVMLKQDKIVRGFVSWNFAHYLMPLKKSDMSSDLPGLRNQKSLGQECQTLHQQPQQNSEKSKDTALLRSRKKDVLLLNTNVILIIVFF
ncbi:hypothetical protein AVEN_223117-1 [Araneus ventricosus]|uniref:MHD1 domain-containing protein n=1 Tax=Araneus ventricosus TaxID=182803 RepID=A0A4Y2E9X5_ARAVE|nr:hypothetical protein AVEN_223117-1 [Araneus ventricosus]